MKDKRKMLGFEFLLLLLMILPFSSISDGVVLSDIEWKRMDSTPTPSSRDDVQIAYDIESDKMILFSGNVHPDTHPPFNDLWAYDLETNTWTNKTISIMPEARAGGKMAYDKNSDRTILFGGGYYEGDEFKSCKQETWAYDYNTNNWENRTPQTNPPVRGGFAFAYDSESDRVILFGGINLSGKSLDDTWAYDYVANTWSKMKSSVKPPAVGGVSMAYDSESDRMILFGGSSSWGENEKSETWAYDYNSNKWTDLKLKNNPNGFSWHGFVYNTKADSIISFGGQEALLGTSGNPIGIKGVSDKTWILSFQPSEASSTSSSSTSSTTPTALFSIAIIAIVLLRFNRIRSRK